MIKIITFISFLLLFMSCRKNEFKPQEKEFSRLDIIIPKYYSNYDYRKFWEAKDFVFTFSNYTPSDNNEYKDSTSTNFFDINFGFANIMRISKKERLEYFETETGLKPIEITDRYEIYKNEYVDTFRTIKGLHNYSYKFISVKDSVDVHIRYRTFDNNQRKLNDFKIIVSQISRELRADSRFRTMDTQ